VLYLIISLALSRARARALSLSLSGNLDATDTAEKIGTVIDEHLAK
jgi:hypothetical protein